MLEEIIILLLFIVLLAIFYKAFREPAQQLLADEKSGSTVAFLLALALSIMAIAQAKTLLETLKTMTILIIAFFIVFLTIVAIAKTIRK